MKETNLQRAFPIAVEREKKAILHFIKTEIQPMGDFGNPEALIKKPYEMWTPQDLALLGQIYGPEPNHLSKFIAGKEIDKMYAAEAEVNANG